MQIAYKTSHEETMPTGYELDQNYPNPFNPSTEIRFYLPEPGEARLEVYDVLGELVATLAHDVLSEGQHRVTWDSKDSDGRDVSSGVYFYRLVVNDYAQTKKMVLAR